MIETGPHMLGGLQRFILQMQQRVVFQHLLRQQCLNLHGADGDSERARRLLLQVVSLVEHNHIAFRQQIALHRRV